MLDTRRGAITLSALLLAGALLTALAFPLIQSIMAAALPPCAMNYFGLNCPLCGGTRCTAALAHGDIMKAIYYNPLVTVMYALLGVLYVRLVCSCFTKPYRRLRVNIPSAVSWSALAVLIAFFIVRNLPFYRAVFF